jgi:hypothetical protein
MLKQIIYENTEINIVLLFWIISDPTHYPRESLILENYLEGPSVIFLFTALYL